MVMIEIHNWAKSAEQRAIPLFKSEDSPLKPILIIGGVHGDEPEGVALAEATLTWLKSHTSDAASQKKITPWMIIPCLNPDGLFRHERTNGNGVDLNRNYPSRNWNPTASKPRYAPGPKPASEPEIQALIQLIQTVKPRLIIHCHSWEPCVVYAGEPARQDAIALGNCSGYEVRDDIGYPTYGSLSQYGWHDHQIPIICIEEQEGTPLTEVWGHFAKGMQNILTNPSLREIQLENKI